MHGTVVNSACTQLALTFTKSAMETPEHYLKFVQSLKTPERREDVILVFLLLTFTHYYGLSIVDFEQLSVGLVGIILFSSKFCKFVDAID